MEGHKHFSHPHTLSFHQNLEGAQLTCTGCNFPCTDTTVYACHACRFFLHEQCFDATRSLIHSSHPDHPLSLFPSPTYTSRTFICKSCNETGSGFCFACCTCEFDLHIHCAYNNLNPIRISNPPPNQIILKSHPNHPLKYLPNSRYSGSCSCIVCGVNCDLNGELYHCDICDYVAHVNCTRLPETVRREDHEHTLSLLHVNPYPAFECDVCRGTIAQYNSMYLCKSVYCDYGTHVKCVSAKVSDEPPMGEMAFHTQVMNKRREFTPIYLALAAIMVLIFAIVMASINSRGYYSNSCYLNSCYRSVYYCDAYRCIYTYTRIYT
ncbi:hypothetical protein L1987_68801 [Smallanthus sonchifolius]|uniref:Uncharacterized protein n=1 Tax=Smallanthus sonchifolius TaxID=185202 RepID=A0ACB9B9A6_9ASTR|nr:hypothetical protein L1987_68801 [Smallanthus sonchifolius]